MSIALQMLLRAMLVAAVLALVCTVALHVGHARLDRCRAFVRHTRQKEWPQEREIGSEVLSACWCISVSVVLLSVLSCRDVGVSVLLSVLCRCCVGVVSCWRCWWKQGRSGVRD